MKFCAFYLRKISPLKICTLIATARALIQLSDSRVNLRRHGLCSKISRRGSLPSKIQLCKISKFYGTNSTAQNFTRLRNTKIAKLIRIEKFWNFGILKFGGVKIYPCGTEFYRSNFTAQNSSAQNLPPKFSPQFKISKFQATKFYTEEFHVPIGTKYLLPELRIKFCALKFQAIKFYAAKFHRQNFMSQNPAP